MGEKMGPSDFKQLKQTISTTNRKPGRGKYWPHTTISKQRMPDGQVHVKCLKCGKQWTHDRGFLRVPSKCL